MTDPLAPPNPSLPLYEPDRDWKRWEELARQEAERAEREALQDRYRELERRLREGA